MLFSRQKNHLPTPEEALKGRAEPGFAVPDRHTVLGNPLVGPYPEGLVVADFGLGCFWGAERKFWQAPGVGPPSSATRAATPRTPRTRRSAAASPATPRPSASCSTRPSPPTPPS
ncbi:hypothetical protein SANTM175S_02482 [Streptomyces antimycoticus]